MTSSTRHPRNGAAAPAVVCVVAVVGYMMAGWSLIEAAYIAQRIELG